MDLEHIDRADQAIDAAKSFFAPVSGEPLIPSSMVRLREAGFALEVLWGYGERELRHGHDPRSAYALLQALKGAHLVARAYREGMAFADCPIIPVWSWPELPERIPATFQEPDNASEAWPGRAARALSGFWVTTVQWDRECRGHVGELPVVAREDSIAWLDRARFSKVPGDIQRPATKADTERLYLEFVQSYDGRDPPRQREREEWRKRNGITRERLRELQREFSPEDWSKPGRR